MKTKTKHTIFLARCRHIMDDKHIKVRAKNVGKNMPKTGTFYRTPLTIEDATGYKCPVYSRGKAQFYADIPMGSNDLGIIYKGHFCYLGVSANPYTLDATDALERRSQILKDREESIFDRLDRLLTQYKAA